MPLHLIILSEGFLQVDLNTIRSLAIFKTEKHPCQTMKIGTSKEGLSLYGILNKTRSVVGKELLRQWFLQPLMDIDILNDRYDSIEVMYTNYNLKNMNSTFPVSITKNLRKKYEKI